VVEVKFQYDEDLCKWSACITGVDSKQMARDAFVAVVMTCHLVDPVLQQHALVDENYNITPAV